MTTATKSKLVLIERYPEYQSIVESPPEFTPLVMIVLYDSRAAHQNVSTYLQQSRVWLSEQALQTGLDIVTPAQVSKRAFQNPSALIAKDLGIKSNELPGYLLLCPHGDLAAPTLPHFVYLPKVELDFSNLTLVQQDQAQLFSQIQEILHAGGSPTDVIDQLRNQLGLPSGGSTTTAEPAEIPEAEKHAADLFLFAMKLMGFEAAQVIGMAGNKAQSGNAAAAITKIASLDPSTGDQWKSLLEEASAPAPPKEKAMLALDILDRGRCDIPKTLEALESLDTSELPEGNALAEVIAKRNELDEAALEEAARPILTQIHSELANECAGWAGTL